MIYVFSFWDKFLFEGILITTQLICKVAYTNHYISARCYGESSSRISIKLTTNEGIEKEGIAKIEWKCWPITFIYLL